MLETAGRSEDLAVLRVRSPQETAQGNHALRLRLPIALAEAAFELGLDMGWVKIRELTYSPVKI